MHFYDLHGYRVQCDWKLPIPNDPCEGASPDLKITRLTSLLPKPDRWHEMFSSEGHPVAWLGASGEQFVLDFQKQASFLFSEFEIGVMNSFLPEGDLNTLLMSQIIPMALSSQADLILHASGVSCENRAWGFLGLEGSGKSTLAASFWQKDFTVLSDDSLRVNLSAEQAEVYFGTPEIRIFSSAIKKLFKYPEKLKLSPAIHKERILIPGHRLGAILLAGIFCLNPISAVDSVKIENLKPIEAMPYLLRSIFRIDLDGKVTQKKELLSCVNFLEKVPAYLVTYPHSWEMHDDLVQKMLRVMQT